uniref:Uncharacterized protein n=1 Tax=Tetranychus urticae TaxID=32264 RepID=T1JVF8_TETUR
MWRLPLSGSLTTESRASNHLVSVQV